MLENAGSVNKSGLPPIRCVTSSYTKGATSLNSGVDTVLLAENLKFWSSVNAYLIFKLGSINNSSASLKPGSVAIILITS